MESLNHRASALALLNHALIVLKQMPFKTYNAPNVVRAMVAVETAIKELEDPSIERGA